jgi:transposase
MEEKDMGTRSYTKEYKVEAVKLAKEIGPKKAAQELGMPEGTLGGWVREAKHGVIDLGKGSQTPEGAMTLAGELQECRKKNKELEKENARLAKENEFLEEASRFFAASRKK